MWWKKVIDDGLIIRRVERVINMEHSTKFKEKFIEILSDVNPEVIKEAYIEDLSNKDLFNVDPEKLKRWKVLPL